MRQLRLHRTGLDGAKRGRSPLAGWNPWRQHEQQVLRIRIVPILYRERDFDAFDNFCDFVESVSYGVYKTCQVRGSNPCRGAKHFIINDLEVWLAFIVQILYVGVA